MLAVYTAPVALITGCTTVQDGTNTVQVLDPVALQLIAVGAKASAVTAVTISVHQHPGNADWFKAAAPIIRDLAENDTTPEGLQASLSKIQVDGLNQQQVNALASLVVDAYQTAYVAVGPAGPKQDQIKLILTKVAEGVELAVQNPTAAQKAKAIYRR
jgi:hypothetical protein